MTTSNTEWRTNCAWPGIALLLISPTVLGHLHPEDAPVSTASHQDADRQQSIDSMKREVAGLSERLRRTSDAQRFDILARACIISDAMAALIGTVPLEQIADVHYVRYQALYLRAEHDHEATYEERIEWAGQAIEHSDNSNRPSPRARARQLRAMLAFEAGKTTEAHELLVEALASEPYATRVKPFLLLALAEVETHVGDFVSAQSHLEQAAELAPPEAPWDFVRERIPGVRAQYLLAVGMLDEAEVLIRKEAALVARLIQFPRADARLILSHALRVGRLHLERGRAAEAVRHCNLVLASTQLVEQLPVWRDRLQALRAQALVQEKGAAPASPEATVEEPTLGDGAQSTDRQQAAELEDQSHSSRLIALTFAVLALVALVLSRRVRRRTSAD